MESRYWNKVLNRQLRRRSVLAAMGGAAASAALAACGGDDEGGADGDSATTQNPPAEQGTPKKGGIITSWSTSALDNAGIDSYLNWSGANSNFTSMIYSKLTKLKTGPTVGPQQYVVDLDLAAQMEQPDPTTYVFKIHPNAKWQNVAPLNGRPITAADVVWNVNLWHQKGVNRALTQPWVEQVEAVDATTVRFKLKAPLAGFPLYIGHTGGPFIMPPELKENDATREKTASSGPFILDKYDVGSAVYFKKNPDYFRTGLPHVDGLTWSIIKDASTISSNIRTGALDVALWNGTVPFQDVAALKKATPGYKWLDVEFINIVGWTFDLADPRYKDERVRQAFSVAMDREGAFGVTIGPGTKYNSPLPPYAPWWLDPKTDPTLKPYYTRDVQKAKQLLSAAGFPDGMDVTYMYNASQASAGVPAEIDASYWQSTLKDAGLRLQLEPVQQAVWFQKGQQGQAPGMFYKGAGHFNSDPDEGLTLVFDPKSPRSPVTNKQLMGDDAKMLELMGKIKQELNATARKQQVDEIQKHLSQRMYVIGSPIPLSYYFASKRLKNMYWIMHYAYGPIVADTWIDES